MKKSRGLKSNDFEISSPVIRVSIKKRPHTTCSTNNLHFPKSSPKALCNNLPAHSRFISGSFPASVKSNQPRQKPSSPSPSPLSLKINPIRKNSFCSKSKISPRIRSNHTKFFQKIGFFAPSFEITGKNCLNLSFIAP